VGEGGVADDLETLHLVEITHGIDQFNHSISAIIKGISAVVDDKSVLAVAASSQESDTASVSLC